MNVWILTIGEPLPKKGEQVRLYRSGILAETLVARGHKVTWFTSNFDHFTKTFHDEKEIGGTAKIILLPGTGYKRNISLARFKDHVKVAQSFREVASKQEEPDIILASVPIMELALEALDYAEPRGIPVVLDARDMWPDMFDEALPRAFKPIAKVLFSKLRKETREGFSRATAILGHTESFVEWGLSYANRERTDQDRAFYF
ncbi:MAG: glycosyltransferase [Armatimonadetes bacterium]|nr:glycosyltransferase [Armatimonadota bacterium]